MRHRRRCRARRPNHVLKMDLNVVSYAGFIHNFENAAVDTWVSQDWSAYEGISFWLYGNNSGTTLFVDVLDNRNPGSTKDDAERWSIDVPDNFSGWQEIKIPFASMHRKEIGNGAPNDGFGLTEVHGWALGSITTPAPQTYYVDNAMVYGVAPIKPLTVGFSTINYKVTEGGDGDRHGQAQQAVERPGDGAVPDHARPRDPQPRLRRAGRRHADLPAERHPAVVHGGRQSMTPSTRASAACWSSCPTRPAARRWASRRSRG